MIRSCIIACGLLALFLVSITPAALIHEFHGHSDTRCSASAQSQVDCRHIHCQVLLSDMQIFTTPSQFLVSPDSPVPFTQPVISHVNRSLAAPALQESRGPPSI